MSTTTANKAATSPADYLHIVAWGRSLGSMMYYIRAQQENAFAAKAPVNAVYEKSLPGGARSGEWVTIDDCHPDTQDRINFAVQQIIDTRGKQ